MIGYVATVTAAPTGGMIGVQLPGQSSPVSIPTTRDVSAAVGETVLVLVDRSQAWCVGLFGVAAAPPPPPPPPIQDEGPTPPPRTVEQQTVTRGTRSLTPSWTGTWRAGAWRGDTSDLFQGDYSGRGLNSGAAFIDGADALGTITGATLHLVRESNAGSSGGQAPTIVLLGSARATSSYPSVIATAAGPTLAWGQAADWEVPAGWLTHLETGAATGFGIQTSTRDPYIKIDGSELYLTVSWERTN